MDRNPERSKAAPYLGATAMAVVAIVVLRLVWPGLDDHPHRGVTPRSCMHLVVSSSTEKAGVLTQVADAYNRTAPQIGGACVHVDVIAKTGGATVDALVQGWKTSVDGPRPDVWTPVSTNWLKIATQRFAKVDAPDLIPDEVGHVATGPTVIAMPRAMAEAMGWPTARIGWTDVFELANDPAGWGRFGHPEWGAFRLGKTNPTFSTSGLNTLIAEYYAATGTSSDLTLDDLRDPDVVRFVKGVESSVVHYGDISITFLTNLRKADDAGRGLTYVSAVAVEEKAVWDYNQGNPTGDPDALGKLPPPKNSLVAIYPKEGTIVNDHPYVALDAPWVTAQKRAAAEAFLRFIDSPAEQARFQAAAFRDVRGVPGPRVVPANGLLPQEPRAILAPPSGAVLEAIQSSWPQLRKPAHVLLVMDVSGSMGDTAAQGASKLELAKRAAIAALDEFAPGDEVGLWIFSTDWGPHDKPYLELVPIEPVGPNRHRIEANITSLEPSGGTALYATIRSAVTSMDTGFDPARINGVVILTDGKNEFPQDDDLDGLLEQLQNERPERAVRVFAIAYGADADLPVLQKIADASLGAAYDASDPATIDKVFAAVITNF